MEEPDGRRQRMRVNSENSFSGSEQLLFEARWLSGKAWVCKTLIVGSTPIRASISLISNIKTGPNDEGSQKRQ